MTNVHNLNRPLRLALAALVVAACAVGGARLVPAARAPTDRDLDLVARQYYYSPHRFVVEQGDTVHVHLAALDVVHGFFLEGHDIEAMVVPGEAGFRARTQTGGEIYDKVDEIVFTADRPGKYRYRCSVTCGPLHPFMQGELIVRPNRTFGAGAGAAVGIFCSAGVLMLTAPVGRRARQPWRFDLLTAVPALKWFVTRRWFNFAFFLPCLMILTLFLLAGIWGSPIGNRNIIITIVWIFWWFLLITLLVPFGGRVWCMMCPLPAPGEWLSRGKLIGAGRDDTGGPLFKPRGLNRKWPARLSNLWIQNLGFLVVCSISTILVTRPALTAFVLLGLLIVATAVHLVYRRRTFCRYLCPLNSWMGLYAMTAMTEIRSRDPVLRVKCQGKSCMVDSDRAWACPWLVNPCKMERNNSCGLCMECIKACQNDNMTVNARPFCSDTRLESLDEAWMAFIMVVLAFAYSIALLGPWGQIKLWTNVSEFGLWGGFFGYTAVVWVTALAVMPGIWWLGTRVAQVLMGPSAPGTRDLFLRSAYMLVPLGLMGWMAFSFPLIMVNTTHITTSLSDPMGWGWDLFGTAHSRWRPLWPEYMVHIQIPLLLIGLGFALRRGYDIALELTGDTRRAALGLLPHGLLCSAMIVGFIRLFAG